MHMVGVTAEVAEKGGVETAEVQDALGRVVEHMVVE